MERWKIPVRKLAHYLLFALGGFIIYFMLECFSVKHRLIMAIFLGLLFACADEFHQLYSLNRGPGFLDVAIDTFGVITGVILAFINVKFGKKIYHKWEKRKERYDSFQRNNSRKNC